MKLKPNDIIVIRDLFTMFQLAAPMLSGRRCQVNAKAPYDPGAWGVCIDQPDGSVIVELDVEIPYKTESVFPDFHKLYMVFLHEMAHVKMHSHRYYTDYTSVMMCPGTFSVAKSMNRHYVNDEEIQANTIAKIWDMWAGMGADDARVWWAGKVGILSHVAMTPETLRLAVMARPVLAQTYKTMIAPPFRVLGKIHEFSR